MSVTTILPAQKPSSCCSGSDIPHRDDPLTGQSTHPTQPGAPRAWFGGGESDFFSLREQLQGALHGCTHKSVERICGHLCKPAYQAPWCHCWQVASILKVLSGEKMAGCTLAMSSCERVATMKGRLRNTSNFVHSSSFAKFARSLTHFCFPSLTIT